MIYILITISFIFIFYNIIIYANEYQYPSPTLELSAGKEVIELDKTLREKQPAVEHILEKSLEPAEASPKELDLKLVEQAKALNKYDAYRSSYPEIFGL